MSHGTRTLLNTAEVRAAVAAASRAPSVHNTQPWRFSWDGQAFELSADTSRGLTAVDPDGRELLISCGAALYSLRLAVRKLGHDPIVTLFPTGDPRLVARVEIDPLTRPADTMERRLFAAVNRRHTHRGAFEERPIAPELAVALQRAAAEEGAQLHYVTDPGQRIRVLHLARAADRELAHDPAVREELEQWTPQPSSRRRDGVPVTAYAGDRPATDPDDLVIRDFDLDRGVGRLEDVPQRPGAVAVLLTDRDVAEAWVSAGQALQRVLVTAADQWAFAALHSQVTEVPNLRLELQRELCTVGIPQLVMRLGYADSTASTPRRDVDDVLVDLT
jgi:hypothetical protein